MTEASESRRRVMRSEDIEREIDNVLAFADQLAQSIREDSRRAGISYTTAPGLPPDIDDLLRDNLRTVLEDEITPVADATPDGDVEPWELEREVIKKALLGLRAAVLREVARERRVPHKGTMEQLATSIGASYKWDSREIALLILAHESEPRPEHSHVDRLFMLDDVVSIEEVAARVEYVLNRFVRIGVARWFMFEAAEVTDEGLLLKGSLRAYQVHVDEADEPTVGASPNVHRVEMYTDRFRPILQVKGAGVAASRDAVAAVAAALGVAVAGFVPLRRLGSSDIAPESIFMLDVLYTRLLLHAGLRQLNLKVARFKLTGGESRDRDYVPEQAFREDKPTLSAVRFEGTHILDSEAACRLLAIDNRSLVDLQMTAAIDIGDETWRFPASISLETDHAMVTTGYGSVRPELSVGVHHLITHAVADEMLEGASNKQRLNTLLERIEIRARSSVAPEHADLLSDEA